MDSGTRPLVESTPPSFTTGTPPSCLDDTYASLRLSEIRSEHIRLSHTNLRLLHALWDGRSAVLYGPNADPDTVYRHYDKLRIAVSTIGLVYPMGPFDYVLSMDRPFVRRVLTETLTPVLAVEPPSNPPVLFELDEKDAPRCVSLLGPEDPWSMSWLDPLAYGSLAGGGHSTIPALNLMTRTGVREVYLSGFSWPMPNPKFQKTFEEALTRVRSAGILVYATL